MTAPPGPVGRDQPTAGAPVPVPRTPQPPASPADPLSALSGSSRDAYSAVYAELQQFGLQSLAPLLLQYAQQGWGQDTISLSLQNTEQWKTRFAGNELRIKNGFGVLSPADYIAVESQMKQVSKAFGLPAGFYDNTAHLAELIGANMSAAEFQDRALQTWNFVQGGDPAAKQALQQFYGADESHAAAFFLDPGKAQSLIDKQAAAAQIGALGIRNNVSGLGVSQAETFVNQGVTQAHAEQGLQALGTVEPDLLAAAKRAGVNYNDQTALQDFVAGQGQAQRARLQISQNEESLFQSQGGVVSGRPAGGSF